MKFLHGKGYLDQVTEIIESHQDLSAAVAFWGSGVELLFRKRKGKARTRLLCNLGSGCCNPTVIRELLSRPDFEVRQLTDLHAKVVLGDENHIILGSANFSANGLSLEGSEATAWEEAGIALKDAGFYAETKKWFDDKWENSSHSIKENDLDDATDLWESRRSGREQRTRPPLIVDIPLVELKDRKILIAVWQGEASAKSEKEFKKVVGGQQSELPQSFAAIADYWEKWPELPKDTLLISAEVRPKGKVEIGDAYKRYPEADPVPSDGWSMQVVLRQAKVLGVPFTARQRKAIEAAVQSKLRSAWNSAEEDDAGVLMPLHEALTPIQKSISTPRAYFVNVKEGPHRTWRDNINFGYVGAGQALKQSRALKRLRVGDQVFAYFDGGLGYVGYGTVTQEAVPIRDFKVRGKHLLDYKLSAPRPDQNKSNEKTEYAVGVKWISTFEKSRAKKWKGMFVYRGYSTCLLSEPNRAKLLSVFGAAQILN